MEERYYICFDLGYGERGIHERDITEEEVIDWLYACMPPETVEYWLNSSEKDWFEYRDYYVINSREMDLDRWEDRDDDW